MCSYPPPHRPSEGPPEWGHRLPVELCQLPLYTQLKRGLKKTYIKAIVRPASKLHLATLVVEWKPGDINFTGGHEDAGGDISAQSFVGHHYICRVGPVKSFAGTEEGEKVSKCRQMEVY